MALLNLETILISYVITNLIGAVVLLNLWRQNRSRYAGLGYWMVHFACNFTGMALLALRGRVPDIFSMLLGNAVLVGGLYFLYKGIQLFVGRRTTQIHNFVLLGLYVLLQTWFIYVRPSLAARNILISVFLILFSLQIGWFLLRRASPEMRRFTRGLQVINLGFILVSVVRILLDVLFPPAENFFQPGTHGALVYLGFQMLYIILTYNLFMLVNRRLLLDLEQELAGRKQTELALQLSQEKYSKAFQSSPDAIIISGLNDGRFLEVNDTFHKITGFTPAEILGNTTLNLGLWVEPRDREKFVMEMKEKGQARNFQVDVRVKSGKVLRVEISGEVIKFGGENYMLSVIRDITEQKHLQDILNLRLKLWEFSMSHSALELMQKALDELEKITGSQIGFYHLVDEEHNSLTLQAWSTRTQKEFCQAQGSGLHYPIDQAGVWVDCVRQRKPVIHNDYASLPNRKGMPAGHAVVVRELVVPILQDERVVSILGIGNKPADYDQADADLVEFIAGLVWSIVSQKQADERILMLNSQLEKLAMTDELTGLPNRRSFFQKGSEEILRTRRYHPPLTLIMLDIDRFKTINDTFGHEYGDRALQCIAKILKEHTREVDIPARLGGEEFGVLLPSTKLAEAAILAERLRKAIEGLSCPLHEKTIVMTASFGVATFNEGMKNLDDLFRSADTALYQAKNQGRNQVVLAE